MSWQVTSAQSLGAQHEQQDCLGAWPSEDGETVLVVLADGAGGHHGGQQAAQTAAEMARCLWQRERPGMDRAREFLEMTSRAAHDAIAALPLSPRTTWLALMVGLSHAEWVHSGDSRLYHFVAGRLALRTQDHSLIQILVEKGQVAERETRRHPVRSVLLQSLGGPEYLPVGHGSAAVGREDVFILCTDGVWSALSEAYLLNLARCSAQNRQRAAEELIARAVNSGGNKADNASLWIVGR
ncbi:MAG TPA: protein phosphatase 2C domain-containing protein [Candidatus Methylacidiphilales bacterium]|nr:protein phosphatase 2C domain-containing protein [Candidatus Methylacidiphilales bacterium]